MTGSPPPPLDLRLHALDATEALAGRIAALLRRGDAILLSGPLGAGKSALARAIIRAAAADPALDVPSPSFTLVQSYETPKGMIHHYDLWRVEPGPDLRELGLDDALSEITLIEWPDRLDAYTPVDALEITLDPRPDGERRAHLSGWPDRLHRLMDQP
ncbi:tRNA (adenosine(37)-N6)-threonylcarbamoyltransferase complex ATPase subunit type 1 TsaE [Acidisoma cellulosilytica]|uniref:tRNA threonylcarbamoyladenosine biosynthesis protein TsaE n=1 Tax=Acidisoma cellulosilyticum TaxID=2802395 RepID=A0A963Z2B5_9PROT|nr:tRNA (adenosine(37)-N6)-threonylcarbamoyltransferase complex ATPase subunit type 1 TsaE [Acidisoma cellulosilyticum]MCB8880565.1 tRNA (adenosine(37)-N6)-threonylcarbamoyltransferase complex ATPase subunit type 1 TsaE [Acidisoma cellulosilyticum]